MSDKEIKELRNKYNRDWRAKNKDKVKQYNKSYWERRAKKEAAENKEEHVERNM